MANKKQLAKKKFLKQKKQEEYNRKKIADFMEMLPVEESIELEQSQQYFFDSIENYGTQRTMVERYQKKINWAEMDARVSAIDLNQFDAIRLTFMDGATVYVPMKYVDSLKLSAKEFQTIESEEPQLFYKTFGIVTLKGCANSVFKVYDQNEQYEGRFTLFERFVDIKTDLRIIECLCERRVIKRYYIHYDLMGIMHFMSRFQKVQVDPDKYVFMISPISEPYRVQDFMYRWYTPVERDEFVELLGVDSDDFEMDYDEVCARRFLKKMVEAVDEQSQAGGYVLKAYYVEKENTLSADLYYQGKLATDEDFQRLYENPTLVNHVIIEYQDIQTAERVEIAKNGQYVVFSLVRRLLLACITNIKLSFRFLDHELSLY